MDKIPELGKDGIKTYHELIGVLRWEIEIGRFYILQELIISEHPKLTIEGLKRTFRLKGDKAESPTMYLGANLNILDNESGSKC